MIIHRSSEWEDSVRHSSRLKRRGLKEKNKKSNTRNWRAMVEAAMAENQRGHGNMPRNDWLR